jgi:hypothetical protein
MLAMEDKKAVRIHQIEEMKNQIVAERETVIASTKKWLQEIQLENEQK